MATTKQRRMLDSGHDAANPPAPLIVDTSPAALAAAGSGEDAADEAAFDRAVRRAERVGCKLYALSSGRFLICHRVMAQELPDLRAVHALLEQAP